MAWKLEGTYFESCSCEVVCPCIASLALGADYDRCRVTLVFNVTDGEVDGTDVSGVTVAAVEGLVPLIGENVGLERAPIELREEGLRHSVKIGDAVDIEIEDVVPFGVESGEAARLTGIFHPASSELTISKAARARVNAFGIEYEGKSGFSASRFAWAA
ncbi:MAG: DUF1326 domain-containing protein [Thermoleophilaceae bacterium]